MKKLKIPIKDYFKMTGFVFFHFFTLGLFLKWHIKKETRKLEKEIELQRAKNKQLKKIDEWCEVVIKFNRCNHCNEPAKLISKELKYCNKCGFSYNKIPTKQTT